MLQRQTQSLLPFAATVLRVTLGVIFVVHGLAKLQDVGAFVGFVASMGVPGPMLVAWVVILMETLGGLLLIVGFGTRWLSLYFVAEMVVTTLLVKVAHGVPFIVADAAVGLGFEMDLLMLVCSVAVFALGSGELSIDRNVLRRERSAMLL